MINPEELAFCNKIRLSCSEIPVALPVLTVVVSHDLWLNVAPSADSAGPVRLLLFISDPVVEALVNSSWPVDKVSSADSARLICTDSRRSISSSGRFWLLPGLSLSLCCR